jgi:hypothetical protein
MTLGTLFNVRVEKPRSALAATMNQMRAWLDAQKVQPATLKVAPTDNGVVFESGLRSSITQCFSNSGLRNRFLSRPAVFFDAKPHGGAASN